MVETILCRVCCPMHRLEIKVVGCWVSNGILDHSLSAIEGQMASLYVHDRHAVACASNSSIDDDEVGYQVYDDFATSIHRRLLPNA